MGTANQLLDKAAELTPNRRAKVSVVIPCYNQANYLADSLRSVFAQTFQDFEVIVVDDGSTDDTAAAARLFPEVRYFKQAKQGLSAARNTGLRESTGEYLCFLDADDRLLPQALQAGVDCFLQHLDSAFVYGDFRYIDQGGAIQSEPKGFRVERDHFKALLEGNFIAMHATVMYRRDVLESAGGFDTGLGRCEDYDLYLRIAKNFPVREHREVVAEYRQHDENMSRDHLAMVKTALFVLHRQKRGLPREMRRAARRGDSAWRDYYGPLMLDGWIAEFRTKGADLATLRRLAQIARWCPRDVLRLIKRNVLKLLPSPKIQFGSLRRVTPFSRQFGFDRGMPVDRFYIEKFLACESGAIHGRVLEIGDDFYTRRFGGDKVTGSEVLHVDPRNASATIIADLADAPNIVSNSFDCIILTQTLHFIYDLRAALRTLERILKPGGTLLVTTPGISQICRDQADREGDSWRLTASSARRLFAEFFPRESVSVESFGNVLTAASFLYGLAALELEVDELEHNDPDYQLIVAIKATKCS